MRALASVSSSCYSATRVEDRLDVVVVVVVYTPVVLGGLAALSYCRSVARYMLNQLASVSHSFCSTLSLLRFVPVAVVVVVLCALCTFIEL